MPGDDPNFEVNMMKAIEAAKAASPDGKLTAEAMSQILTDLGAEFGGNIDEEGNSVNG